MSVPIVRGTVPVKHIITLNYLFNHISNTPYYKSYCICTIERTAIHYLNNGLKLCSLNHFSAEGKKFHVSWLQLKIIQLQMTVMPLASFYIFFFFKAIKCVVWYAMKYWNSNCQSLFNCNWETLFSVLL